MSDHKNLAQQFIEACSARDVERATSLLHPRYTLRDAMMQLNGPKEFADFMQSCPFDGRVENVRTLAAEGDTVVIAMDCVMTSPVAFTIHLCDVITLKDGKVFSEETFYDTATIPEEAKRMGQQGDKSQKHQAA